MIDHGGIGRAAGGRRAEGGTVEATTNDPGWASGRGTGERRAVSEQSSVDVRDLVAQAPTLMAYLDGPDHIYTFASPSYERVVGRAVHGRTIRDALPDLAGQGFYELLDAVYHDGTPFVATEMPAWYDRDGDGAPEETYVSFTLQPQRAADGAITGILVTGSEVTETVRARQRAEAERARLLTQVEEARAAAELERQRLRDVFQQAPTLIAVLGGPEHIYEFVNPAYERIAGRGGALIGRTVRDAFPEIEGQGFYELLDAVYREGVPYTATEALVRLDRRDEGTMEDVYVTFVYQPMRDAAGAVAGIVVQGVEVTAQVQAHRRTEEAGRRVQAEHDRLQQVLEVLPEAVVLTDARGEALMANTVARELLGADIVGRSLARVEREASATGGMSRLDGSPYPSDELPLERSVRRGEEVRGVQALLPPTVAEGSAVPVLMNSVPLRDDGGAITGAIVVFQDITTIKNFERARDALLATVTHDLKNPLTAIQGLAELTGEQAARKGTPSSEQVVTRQAGIVTAATQMTGLLNELLDVMQLELGQPLALDRRPTDLVALVRRVVDYQREIAAHPIQVDAAVATVVCTVDTERMERVIGNLVSNAIKYSPQGAGVTVRLARARDAAGGWAVLAVEDRGRGIPEEDLPHVFDRFYRAENVGAVEGTGIGLASVREIVEQHGGTVAIESQEDRGTTITVRLPASEAPKAGAPASSST